MQIQHSKSFWVILRLVVLGLFLAQTEAKATIIGTPDNSFVYSDGVAEWGLVTVDYTNTILSGSQEYSVGDFNDAGGLSHVRGSANLASGELRIYADALAGYPNSVFGGASAEASGVVGFGDRVFINGSWTGLLPVEISLGLHGSYTPINGTGFSFILNTAPGSGVWATEQLDIFNGAPIPSALTTTVMVSEFQPWFDFTSSVYARAQDITPLVGGGMPQWSVANFENTGRLSIALPSSSFSFTSESGVLLTQPAASVPEPSSLLLLGAGLVGLAAWQRKRAA